MERKKIYQENGEVSLKVIKGSVMKLVIILAMKLMDCLEPP